jgi:transcriptional regulator with XRE-family HTH domain
MGVESVLEFDNRAVGRAIRSLRRERGLSQEVLSGFAGIARTHLTMIENGTKQANFETIWRIALALELRPSQLVEYIERECAALGSGKD